MEKVGRMLWQCRNLPSKWTTSDPVFSVFSTVCNTFWNPLWDVFTTKQMTEIPSTWLSMIHGDWFAAMQRGHFCNTSSDELRARGFDMNSEPAVAHSATHQTATQWNEGNQHELTMSWGKRLGIFRGFGGFTVPLLFRVFGWSRLWIPMGRSKANQTTTKVPCLKIPSSLLFKL